VRTLGGGKVLALLAGLHYLVLSGQASWDDPFEEHEAQLREWMERYTVQTNEVQRSWVLLPLFLHATRGAEAVHVLELGASAGLNLVWDRFRYEYEAGSWGSADAWLTLRGEERRPIPAALLGWRPTIRSRVGIDRAPVDLRGDDAARYLKAFVWADQDERMRRLESVIEAVRADPPQLVAGELPDALPVVLDGIPDDGLVLVFQTAVLGYLTQEGRNRVRDYLQAVDRDLVFVSAGTPRGQEGAWGMRIFRPGKEREFIGHADFHGAWLDYDLGRSWTPSASGRRSRPSPEG
jgi:hypothetical protein